MTMVLTTQMDLTELMTMMMERPIISVSRVRPLVLVRARVVVQGHEGSRDGANRVCDDQ